MPSIECVYWLVNCILTTVMTKTELASPSFFIQAWDWYCQRANSVRLECVYYFKYILHIVKEIFKKVIIECLKFHFLHSKWYQLTFLFQKRKVLYLSFID